MEELQTVGHTEAQSCHLVCSLETELAELSGLLFVGWKGNELPGLRIVPPLRVTR